MTSLTHKARQTFALDRYATEATGAVIDEVGDLTARCSLRLQPQHRNAMGAVMGGVIFTLGDLAFAAAANSQCLAEDKPIAWVSTSSTVHFLAQPRTDALTTHAQCVKQGRTTCLYNIDVHDGQGNLVAQITTSGMKLS